MRRCIVAHAVVRSGRARHVDARRRHVDARAKRERCSGRRISLQNTPRGVQDHNLVTKYNYKIQILLYL